MPVKWTPDNDHILLLKLLETHPAIAIDTGAISASWPSDREKPSPRAITERFVKIRQLARASGAGNFSVSASPTSNAKKARPTSTRAKAPATANRDSTGAGVGKAKAKRGGTIKSKAVGPKIETLSDAGDEMGSSNASNQVDFVLRRAESKTLVLADLDDGASVGHAGSGEDYGNGHDEPKRLDALDAYDDGGYGQVVHGAGREDGDEF
ncbi:MAG: hypothetical protein M1838_000008 [Thelocarpon superellum]|nr:MAG: hypothetical protein M1838_000008 [Thelocarpon superellum]